MLRHHYSRPTASRPWLIALRVLAKVTVAVIICVVALLLVAGCEPKPQVEKPKPELDLSAGRAVLERALDRITDKTARADVEMAIIYFDDGLKKTAHLAAINAEQVRELQKQLEKARGLEQFRGAYYTMGVAGGACVILGIVLWTSGLLAAFPKVGGSLIAGGAAGIVLAVVVPELPGYAKIVSICGAACTCLLLVLGTGYIIQKQWKTVRQTAATVEEAKGLLSLAKRSPDADIPTIGDMVVQQELQTPDVEAINAVARKQVKSERKATS